MQSRPPPCRRPPRGCQELWSRPRGRCREGNRRSRCLPIPSTAGRAHAGGTAAHTPA
ncbi:hypothetical protein [Ornithinimicrobium kibberense]|uniref:hypothetical protein n=1 Tax=Ornithinimicrobium kibberense TaxID=282060 RepID=UPI00360CC80D